MNQPSNDEKGDHQPVPNDYGAGADLHRTVGHLSLVGFTVVESVSSTASISSSTLSPPIPVRIQSYFPYSSDRPFLFYLAVCSQGKIVFHDNSSESCTVVFTERISKFN